MMGMDVLIPKKRVRQFAGPAFPRGESVAICSDHVGQVGNLRRIGNPPVCEQEISLGRLPIGRRLPTCPTSKKIHRGARRIQDFFTMFVAVCCTSQIGLSQKPLSWAEVQDRFKTTNPTLQAARIGIDESRAQEITANLRPNPTFTGTLDQIDPFTTNPY